VTRVDNTLVQVLDIEKVITPSPRRGRTAHGTLSEEDASLLAAANILVVDDSQVALQQSVHTLRNLGIECHTARSAKDAINVLLELQGTAQEINIIVSDIEMSEMDGYAFTRTLRETPTSSTCTCCCTSLDSAMSSEKATQAGANAILTKFSSPELTDCLVVAARTVVFAEH
jgi:two-component system chemotaxis response regulator CheV